MWNPPIVLTSEEQKIAARTRKTRKFFVFLREHRHELLDADLQQTLANSYSPSLEATSQWKRDCWPSPHSCRLTVTSATGTPSS